MDHVAIMKKSWGLIPKILSGQKVIESRWYQTKRLPWGRIKVGDTVYFKDSGYPTTLKATVSDVLSFNSLTPPLVSQILRQYASQDGIPPDKVNFYFDLFKDKQYCLLVFLQNPAKIDPFDINKAGFGTMSAWITIPDINLIKK